MTLAESMALAVLKGDMVAAYALADKLQEERDEGFEKMAQAAAATRDQIFADGFAVYQWPEFQAFCKRAGILWDLHTQSISFTLEEGSAMVVEQSYLAVDTETPRRPPNG